MRIILPYLFFSLCSFQLWGKPKVLVIESYHSEYEWCQNYRNGLKSVLENEVDFSFFEMDTKRLPKSMFKKKANEAWEEYLKKKPDLVVLADDNALQYLATRFRNTKTPVVFLGINNSPRMYLQGERSLNFTGILERPHLRRSIRYIRYLLKGRQKKILVLFDKGTTSNVLFDTVFNSSHETMISDFQISIRLVKNWQEWKNYIKKAKENYDAIIIGLYQTFQDEKGNSLEGRDVMRWSYDNSSVPLFGFWRFSIGKGLAIGGLVLSGYSQGQQAATMIKKILSGVRVSEIVPEMPEHGRLIFSKSGLKKYKLEIPPQFINEAELID